MNALFPFIDPRIEWKEVNLNEEFIKDNRDLNMKLVSDQNKLVDNEKYTFGGFREDRTVLWEGFEGKGVNMFHLGIDFNNLQPGDIVASLSDGLVIDILIDESDFNGWGTKIIIESDEYYFLYGHLMNPFVKMGNKIIKGDLIGVIASSDKNGGWFPHLHLQVMDKKEMIVDIKEVDGYEFVKGSIKGVVNPMMFISNLK